VLVPVPPLGDSDTPIEEVNKFYEYWVNFESWRDFSIQAAEHDLEDAEDRHHKRWMEKENAKKVKDLKKSEYRRLSRLVDNARAADIRIRRARQAEVDAKKAKKEARLQEKRDAEDAITRAAEEAAAVAAAAEQRQKAAAKDAKAQREVLKKEARRHKKTLRGAFPLAVAASSSTGSSSDSAEPMLEADLEFFCEYGELELLAAAAEALGEQGQGEGGLAVLAALIARCKEDNPVPAAAMEKLRAAEAAHAAAASKKAEDAKKLRLRPWSQEELAALARCSVKFPAGTQNRWQRISEGVAAALGTKITRNKEECSAKYAAETPLFVQIAAEQAAEQAAIEAAAAAEAAAEAAAIKAAGEQCTVQWYYVTWMYCSCRALNLFVVT
jgi:DnaJ homolog subfamily C member 2